eukprot:4732640-Ditylum_brightwellii.AAC.1
MQKSQDRAYVIPYEQLPLHSISSNLTKACQALEQVQENAAMLQDEYLEELSQLNINKNQTNTATIIKNIRHHKEFKQSFCMMHPILKGHQGGAVSSILVLDELDSMSMYNRVSVRLEFKPVWVSIDDEDQVMSTLLRQINYTFTRLGTPHVHAER